METKKIILANFVESGQPSHIVAFNSFTEFIDYRNSLSSFQQAIISEIDYYEQSEEQD